jgi:capsular exopolysaccharide synthesis family protein
MATEPTPGKNPRQVWDYWRIIREGWKILAACLLVTVTVAVVGTLLLPKRYRAEVLIEINLAPATILGSQVERGLSRSYFEQERAFKTEFVRMRTRDMLTRAIAVNDLDQKVPLLGRMRDPIDILQKLTRAEMHSQTNVARLSVSWTDPKAAATIANAIGETYVQSDLDERIQTLTQRQRRLEQSAVETSTTRRAQLQYELSVLERDTDLDTLMTLTSLSSNEELRRLKERQDTLRQELESLVQTHASNHPEVKAKRGQVGEVRRQVAGVVSAVRADVTEELDALGGPLPEAEYRRQESMTREAGLSMQKDLLEKMQEHRAALELAEPKARIIDPALPPKRPYAPNLFLNLALAIVVGGGLGGGLVFFRDYLDVSVRSIDDVERDLGLNLLAVVPHRHAAADDRVVAEAFQTLRTGLLFASRGRRDRVLLVTSAGPQEGKSTVVADLARSLAGSGESVAVVDCDLRRPTAGRLFGVASERGLSNYLADASQADWRPFLQAIDGKLGVLPTGPIPPNPIDLLNLPRFAELLKGLKEGHDWVILDSPPASSVSDSVVLASQSDLLLLVIRHDHTDREVVRRSLGRLQGVGASIVGAVLNDVDMRKGYNRDYYYGRFYYGHYYGAEGSAGGRRAKASGKAAASRRG